MATTESERRKETPLFSGCLGYFPDALAAVARLSKLGNDKHNPGEPLHWSKGKSNDHADCLVRHLVAHGQVDPETGLSHTVAVAWRALALLQTEIEQARAAPQTKADDAGRRKRVYIAGPLSRGDLKRNIEQATRAFKQLVAAGFAAWCPHWSAFSGGCIGNGSLGGELPGNYWAYASACGVGLTHQEWLEVDIAWLATADAVLRLPGESVGADAETAEAERLGIPVYTSVNDVVLGLGKVNEG